MLEKEKAFMIEEANKKQLAMQESVKVRFMFINFLKKINDYKIFFLINY